jgi:hypothetical protein
MNTTTQQSIIAVFSLLFVAIMALFLLVSNAEATEYVIDDWDNITGFVANDSTDNAINIRKSYNCMDFSIDLATNLTKAGWDAGVVLKSGRASEGHALVWVMVNEPYDMFYIEPQLDEVYNPDVYRSGSEETHTFSNVSIETAIRCHNAQKSWW